MKIFVLCENCKSSWWIQEQADIHECPSCEWPTELADYEFPELEIPEKYWN